MVPREAGRVVEGKFTHKHIAIWKPMSVVFTLTTEEAVALFRISSTTLRRLRKDGILKPGIHYRAMGAGVIRSPLIWCGAAVEETLTNRSRSILQ